jgi:ATP-binding cassette subfamily F protein uup
MLLCYSGSFSFNRDPKGSACVEIKLPECNGAGKTTLLRILLGQLHPQAGSVGTNLQVVYFDQLRQQLNDEASVQDNVADGYDTVRTGTGSRYVIG